ncbi:MAG TPA: carbohydrate kinase [Lacunisphaera sp.]|jgi:fructokinase
MNESAPSALCFGEILWDFLPRGAFPGGAPFNVAYHLSRLGLRTHLVSAVGRDLLGDELLARLRQWGLSTEGIGRHTGLPTGYVRAAIGPTGDATYDIATEVAWDQIILGEDTIRAAVGASALVFGSLALRSRSNRATLDRLLAVLPANAMRVFDVNLRSPYDDLSLVRELARNATLLKLNAGEAARLANDSPGPGHEEAHAHTLAAQTGCATICISAGERGAGLLAGGKWTWAAGRRVVVRDTVGAGDAFMAGLLAGLILHREKLDAALDRACRMGEYVAAHDGATPSYECDLLGQPSERI